MSVSAGISNTTLIPSLLLNRCPSAVLRSVIPLVVDSIKRVLGGSWPHVGQEQLKGSSPSFTDTNSASAIESIEAMPRIQTPLFHACPDDVLNGRVVPDRATMSSHGVKHSTGRRYLEALSMRKGLMVAILLLCLPGMSEAQSCDGCGIKYSPPTSTLTAGGSSFFAGGISLGNTVASPYVNLYGDAANTLALRNGTAAQAFNIYNTYTDASNNEYGGIGWSGNSLRLQTGKNGSGSYRHLYLYSSGGYIFINSVTLEPTTTDAATLGTSASHWLSAYVDRSIQGSKSKALVAATPTAAWDCAIAAGARTGGTIDYCVYGADATDYQYRCGAIKFAAVNKAGTTTCTMSPAAPDQTNDGNAGAITSSTLTYAITCTDTTDSFSLLFNAASGLAETTLQVESRLNLMNPATCTPQ